MIDCLSHTLLSVISSTCFLPALRFSPELPKQRSGILSVPEHTRLLLLVSAEYTVPPISPGPPVLNSCLHLTQASPEHRLQQYDVCIARTPKFKLWCHLKLVHLGEKLGILSVFAELLSLLYWVKEGSCEVSLSPFPAWVHCDFSDKVSDLIPALL